jgi:hypothetical protein
VEEGGTEVEEVEESAGASHTMRWILGLPAAPLAPLPSVTTANMSACVHDK